MKPVMRLVIDGTTLSDTPDPFLGRVIEGRLGISGIGDWGLPERLAECLVKGEVMR